MHSWMPLNSTILAIWFSFTCRPKLSEPMLVGDIILKYFLVNSEPNDGSNYCSKAIEVQLILYAADVLGCVNDMLYSLRLQVLF